MRIVFMGTPDFAVPSLRMLAREGHEVAGVFTNPDKPAGRGKKVVAPPVKLAAESLGIPVYQFEKLRSEAGIEALRSLAPDVFVTAAFGQILSPEALAIPPLGCVNVHASLLPKYRGAGPIQWSIIRGETVTGITTMYTDAGIDTGDMILHRELTIGERETGGALFERLAHLGADVLRETLWLIERGRAPRTPQNHDEATKAPMIRKTMGDIDWAMPSESIRNLVRALVPWPVAFTHIAELCVKVYEVAVVQGFSGEPGAVLASDAQNGLIIATGDGAVEIVSMQPPGGKRMQARDFLRGRPVQPGTVCHGKRSE